MAQETGIRARAAQLKARINTFTQKVNGRRDENTVHYRAFNFLLTAIFPLFIVSMAELNQGKYPSKFILFCAERPSVMVFNVLIASLIFGALLVLFKRAWRAMAVQSVLYMALSIVELFKFNTNGNHLILTDMKLAKNVKNVASFAYIKITPQLVTYILIVLAFLAIAFWFNPKQGMHRRSHRFMTAGVCIATCCSIVLVPGISTPVYALFDVDTSEADNTFQLNEKFENNNFLAFFLQTASANLADRLKEPENYDAVTVNGYLDDVTVLNEDGTAVSPNVITIMSEAFADFRVFESLGNCSGAYDKFDALAAQDNCYQGTTIVPTFASYTVRTEFELMFGLPVRALNDPNTPQQLIQDDPQSTIIRNYAAQGYHTAYIHPFLSSFYNRDTIYDKFGFDTMIFEDDFTVDVNYFGTYVDDDTVFRQAGALISESEQPMYIHCTTMQNHQPYDQGEDPDAEFDNYLTWISETGDTFTEFLASIDEPTVVLFVGDHFPSLKGENSVYDQLGMNGDNCEVLYEQNYYIWNNCGLDFEAVPQEKLSAFYLPYVVMDLIGAQRTNFTQLMVDQMQECPIYSSNYAPDVPANEELDLLTYDRILGENISGQAENEELAAMQKE